MKSVAALAALVASASAINPARYVRIYDAQNDASDYINLQLVTVFDCAGNYITPVGATQSSFYNEASYPASNGITNGTGFIHTGTGAAQWYQVDLGATFAVGRVTVDNRADCCQNRIVGYAIALFREDGGQVFASSPQSFVTQQTQYNFYFPDGGCPSPTEIGLGVSNQLARYIYLTKAGTAILNLLEVMAFDCNGNYIVANTAHLSGTHSAPWVASNCINNGTGSGCHSTGTSPWLSIDLGSLVAVSRIVVLNRVDCCSDRIAGFSIGLYSGPNGFNPIVRPQVFTGTATSYTFNFPTVCPMQPAQLAAATTSTAAALAADFNSGMSTAISNVNAALNSLNSNTLTTLAQQVATLSSQIAAESTTANGALTAQLTAAQATLSSVSNQAGAASQGVSSLSTQGSAVSTLAATNNGLITSLRNAIIAAAAATPSGGTGGTPSISSPDGATLQVSSGNCVAMDVCGATSFANTLQAGINSM